MKTKLVVGSTRFSVALNQRQGWRTREFQDFDAYCSHLFSEQRLAIRKAIFIESVLPTLDRQASLVEGFAHLVSYSSLLPNDYKNALSRAAHSYAWLQLEEVEPDGTLRLNLVDVLRKMNIEKDCIFASFRLDDDDFISDNFVEKLSNYMIDNEVDRCVSFSRGYQGYFSYPAMQLEDLREFVFPMNAYGLAVIGRYDGAAGRLLSKYSFPPGAHHTVDRQTPTIIDAQAPMWLRCLTDDNDSNIGKGGGSAAAQILQRWKAVSRAEVVEAVSSAARWISETPRTNTEGVDSIDVMVPKASSVTTNRSSGLFIDLWGEMISKQLPADEAAAKRVSLALTEVLVDGVQRLVTALRPAIVVEIGAHEGSFSTRIKQALPNSRVIAAEANTDVWTKYRPALFAAGVEYLHTCITNKAGKVVLNVPIHPSAGAVATMGSILTDTAYQKFKSFEVDAITLDELLAGDVDKPKALWIDVEGAIEQVLEGASRALSSCILLYAEVETRQRWRGQKTFAELTPILRQLGLVPVLRDVQRPWQFNVIFLREDILARDSIRKACEIVAHRFGRKLIKAADQSARNDMGSKKSAKREASREKRKNKKTKGRKTRRRV